MKVELAEGEANQSAGKTSQQIYLLAAQSLGKTSQLDYFFTSEEDEEEEEEITSELLIWMDPACSGGL